jgi:hypothetical protein
MTGKNQLSRCRRLCAPSHKSARTSKTSNSSKIYTVSYTYAFSMPKGIVKTITYSRAWLTQNRAPQGMGAIPSTDIAVIERGLVIAGLGWSSFVAHMGATGPTVSATHDLSHHLLTLRSRHQHRARALELMSLRNILT